MPGAVGFAGGEGGGEQVGAVGEVAYDFCPGLQGPVERGGGQQRNGGERDQTADGAVDGTHIGATGRVLPDGDEHRLGAGADCERRVLGQQGAEGEHDDDDQRNLRGPAAEESDDGGAEGDPHHHRERGLRDAAWPGIAVQGQAGKSDGAGQGGELVAEQVVSDAERHGDRGRDLHDRGKR